MAVAAKRGRFTTIIRFYWNYRFWFRFLVKVKFNLEDLIAKSINQFSWN